MSTSETAPGKTFALTPIILSIKMLIAFLNIMTKIAKLLKCSTHAFA